jgi:hypothetical protein
MIHTLETNKTSNIELTKHITQLIYVQRKQPGRQNATLANTISGSKTWSSRFTALFLISLNVVPLRQ